MTGVSIIFLYLITMRTVQISYKHPTDSGIVNKSIQSIYVSVFENKTNQSQIGNNRLHENQPPRHHIHPVQVPSLSGISYLSWTKHFDTLWATSDMNLLKQSEMVGPECENEKFTTNLTENLQTVERYHLSSASKSSLDFLKLSQKGIQELLDLPTQNFTDLNFTFVTAASENHYHQLQDFLNSLHKRFFTNKNSHPGLIFYDIGLTKLHSDRVRRHCRCDFRMYPTERVPKPATIARTYAWKPVVIQLAMQDSEYVFWVDTSVRFKTSNIQSVLRRAAEVGVQVNQVRIVTACSMGNEFYNNVFT